MNLSASLLQLLFLAPLLRVQSRFDPQYRFDALVDARPLFRTQPLNSPVTKSLFSA